MPAATNRIDLIEVTKKDFAKLAKLISEIPTEQALSKREDDTSIKDIIGHRAHWIDLFLGWYAAGQRGETPPMPSEGYKWNQLPAYNAKLREAQAGLGWEEARALLADRHNALLQFMEGHDDAALYSAPMAGGGNHWTAGRWAEAAGPSHYRSAAKFIRACLRDDAGS